MSTHDPISDLITRIRNAQMRNKSKVSTPGSKMRANVLEVLKSEGYIRGFASVEHASARHPRDRAGVEAGPSGLCFGEEPAARQ
jgi:ribosomal protein S8